MFQRYMRAYMRDNGLSLSDVARNMGTHPSHVTRLLRDGSSNPETIGRLVYAANMDDVHRRAAVRMNGFILSRVRDYPVCEQEKIMGYYRQNLYVE